MSGCKTELSDETRKEIIESHAKHYSRQIGDRTTKDGEFYEIFEVKTEGGDLQMKIRPAGSDEEGWECLVERISQYEDNWIVGLANSFKKTIMQITGRPDILTPVKEEDFQKVTEYLLWQTCDEKWDFHTQYAQSKHRERIKEAWGIDLDHPSDKAAWKALKEPRKVSKK